jgi:hypothetical protein
VWWCPFARPFFFHQWEMHCAPLSISSLRSMTQGETFWVVRRLLFRACRAASFAPPLWSRRHELERGAGPASGALFDSGSSFQHRRSALILSFASLPLTGVAWPLLRVASNGVGRCGLVGFRRQLCGNVAGAALARQGRGASWYCSRDRWRSFLALLCRV